jgi:hypothetical protein
MPPAPARPVAARPEPPDAPALSPAMLWGGTGVYVVLVLVGFCFGVWAGNQRPKPAEVARAGTPAPANREGEGEKGTGGEQGTPPPSSPPVPPAAPPTPPQPPEKKGPAAAVTPEPKAPAPKPPEPKKPPETKPEPKSPAPAGPQVTFAKEVLPIFRAKCLNCHGAVGSPKGGLDLRTLAAIAKGGDGGDALVAGDLKKSSIWVNIEENLMPPAGKERLTEPEATLIKNWILSGGK